MYKSLIFNVFLAISTLTFSQGVFAGRGRGKSVISRTRINTGGVARSVVPTPSEKSDETIFTLDPPPSGGYSNTQCLAEMTSCLSADNLCGDGMFGCYGDSDITDGTTLSTSSEGQMCSSVISNCQCDPSFNGGGCGIIWDQLFTLIENSQYDAGECQSEFMSCASKESNCGTNYKNCVDLIDTVIGNNSSSDDKIDTKDFLRNWLNQNTNSTVSVLSTELRSLLIQKVSSCDTDVLSRCNGGVLNGSSVSFSFGSNGVNSMATSGDVTNVVRYFFQDFARKAEDGLIAYQETHAKTKWQKAEACVDTLDECMKPHCGGGYKKCLHEDGTVDSVASTNFRSFCQKTLIGCSEIRVEVGLPGYQFLQNPMVDGVETVWNEWLKKKLLAHGNTMATERRELEREHDILVASAQRECQLSGGEFYYKQEALVNYQKKYDMSNPTDDYKGDGGVLYDDPNTLTQIRSAEKVGRTAGDIAKQNALNNGETAIVAQNAWNTAYENARDNYLSTYSVVAPDMPFGNYSGIKADRFYERATCKYNIVVRRSSSISNRSKSNTHDEEIEVFYRQKDLICDKTLFPSILNLEKAGGGKGLRNITGALAGGILGAVVGGMAGDAIINDGNAHKAKVVGAGALGAAGGAVGGIALQKELMKKKVSCAVRRYNTTSSALSNNYIPVAKYGGIISLPPVGKSSLMKGAFDKLDAFYAKHPELVIQRGEYKI